MAINKTCAGRIRAKQSELVDALIEIATGGDDYKPNERMAAIRTLFDSLDAYEAEQRIQLELHPEVTAQDIIVQAMQAGDQPLALPESIELPLPTRTRRSRGRPKASLDSRSGPTLS